MVETKLTQQKCEPCEGKTKPLPKQEAQKYMDQVAGWQLSEDGLLIFWEVTMKNFVAAVDLIRLIAGIAEEDQHHPDIHLTGYRNLRVELSTHAIGGLSENDFIVAAKTNELPIELKKG